METEYTKVKKEILEAAIKALKKISQRYAVVSLTVFFSFPALLIYSIIWDFWTWKPYVVWLIVLFVDRIISNAFQRSLTELKIKLAAINGKAE